MLFGVYIFGVAHSCQEKTAIIMGACSKFPISFAKNLLAPDGQDATDPSRDHCPALMLA
jgi:hypothetical protein